MKLDIVYGVQNPSNLVVNLGQMLVFGILLAVFIATCVFISVVLCLGKYNAWRMYRNGVRMLFYNTIIRFYLVSMMKLMVGSATTLSLLNVSER